MKYLSPYLGMIFFIIMAGLIAKSELFQAFFELNKQ